MENKEQTKMVKRPMKPIHGILLLIACGAELFVVGPILVELFGFYGTLVSELLLLVMAVGTVLIARGDMKRVFPIRRPDLSMTAGTILLWMGTYLGVMIVTLILTCFFPREILGVGQELNSEFMSVPMLVSLLIVGISPAICEEAVFRGAAMSSFWNPKNKWIAILTTSIIFGLFHGSIWRFIPTACLGIVMGYLIVETNNMLYPALFHAINNTLPLLFSYLLLPVLQRLTGTAGNYSYSADLLIEMDGSMVMAAGMYLMYGGAVPLFLYIGNYFIHKGRPGYTGGLFSKERKKALAAILIITAICVFFGVMIMFGGLAWQIEVLMRTSSVGLL